MYEGKIYENIREGILSKIEGIDKREGSFVSDMVSPVSMEIESCYQQFEKMLGIMFLEDSSGIYLEKRAGEYGIARKPGIKAMGKAVFIGTKGTVIPKGSLAGTSSGIVFVTTEEQHIPDDGESVLIPIEAQTEGAKGNAPAETITQLPASIPGITGVNNPEPAMGGTDMETDEALLSRVLYQLRNPATSGNANHYKQWSLEVPGVGDAKIFPLWNGNGTVKVVPVTAEKRKPDQALLDRLAAHIEQRRPIGPQITVEAPTEVSLNVTAQIVLTANGSLSEIRTAYTHKFKEYIRHGVFNIYEIDYFKCLSLLYEIPGVSQVSGFQLNGGSVNIKIQPTEIQIVGTISITEQEGEP